MRATPLPIPVSYTPEDHYATLHEAIELSFATDIELFLLTEDCGDLQCRIRDIREAARHYRSLGECSPVRLLESIGKRLSAALAAACESAEHAPRSRCGVHL